MNPLLQQALTLHRQGDLQAAAALYARLLAAEPASPDALHLLGVLKGQLGERATAIALIERAISHSPRVSVYHNNLGNLLKASGDRGRARESYACAIRCDAKNAEAHLNLARLLLDLSDEGSGEASGSDQANILTGGRTCDSGDGRSHRKAARTSLHKALRLAPTLVEAHLALARLEESEGAYKPALTSAANALRLAPLHPPAHLMHGRLLSTIGDLVAAVEAFERALELDPISADAAFNLGTALYALKQYEPATAALRKAIALAPESAADAWNNLGLCLTELYPPAEPTTSQPVSASPSEAQAQNESPLEVHSYPQSDEAIAAFARAIALKPDYDGACLNLAKEHVKRQQPEAARPVFEQAIRLNPRRKDAYLHLGTLEENAGALDRAAAVYRQGIAAIGTSAADAAATTRGAAEIGVSTAAVEMVDNANAAKVAALTGKQKPIEATKAAKTTPALSELQARLGLVLARSGDLEGLDLLERLVAEQPTSAQATFHLGTALLVWIQQQWHAEADRARHWLSRTLELDPTHADALLNLGVLEERDGDLTAAARLYRSARQAPNPSLDLLNNLGGVLSLQGDPEGITILEQNVLNHPDYPEAHFSLGTALLLNGHYRQGWAEYEWRRKVERLRANCRLSTLPDWAGEPLDGRAILLYSEQGFGDTLQFARLVPLVAARGGRVVLDVQPPLRRLLQHLPGVSVCFDEALPLPNDSPCQPSMSLPLLSLPRIFDLNANNIPDGKILDIPPLHGARQKLAAGIQRADRLRVGLVWAGNPRHQRDRLRSIPWADLAPVTSLDGIDFVSLQTGPAVTQAADFPFAADCANVKDFADTAEIIADLDLVITIDSAVAHLAGAMGKPVWILLANTPDWRWGLHSETTPWYRTARLFRQTRPLRSDGWREVIAEVSANLRSLREATSSSTFCGMQQQVRAA